MIVWTPTFPGHKKPLGYLRLLRARHRFYDRIGFSRVGRFGLKFGRKLGYQHAMWNLKNSHKNQPCYILGNGPSLSELDLSPLRDKITIGSNGIYTKFNEWGFSLKYMLFEDIEQTEKRGADISSLKNTHKLVSIYNAYAFQADRKTTFFNARLGTSEYWNSIAPAFSTDFGDIVYLGSTITYVALQWAFHLGCDPVYLLGVDHDYGELSELFPPGKLKVTEENYSLVQKCHFEKDYYQLGDEIGVPNLELQHDAYRKAREVYETHGRKIYNANPKSKLDVFDKCEYNSIFDS
jgi:hypothetical protein